MGLAPARGCKRDPVEPRTHAAIDRCIKAGSASPASTGANRSVYQLASGAALAGRSRQGTTRRRRPPSARAAIASRAVGQIWRWVRRNQLSRSNRQGWAGRSSASSASAATASRSSNHSTETRHRAIPRRQAVAREGHVLQAMTEWDGLEPRPAAARPAGAVRYGGRCRACRSGGQPRFRGARRGGRLAGRASLRSCAAGRPHRELASQDAHRLSAGAGLRAGRVGACSGEPAAPPGAGRPYPRRQRRAPARHPARAGKAAGRGRLSGRLRDRYRGATRRSAHTAPLPPSTGDTDALAALLYTSGSTGPAQGRDAEPCEPLARSDLGRALSAPRSRRPDARGVAAELRRRAEPVAFDLGRGRLGGAARLSARRPTWYARWSDTRSRRWLVCHRSGSSLPRRIGRRRRWRGCGVSRRRAGGCRRRSCAACARPSRRPISI